MAGVEFDVDLIYLLHGAGSLGAKEMFRMVVAELRGRYPDLMVKDRCCRIDYAGEFHMDIIPACPELGVEIYGACLCGCSKIREAIPSRSKAVTSCCPSPPKWC